MIVDHGSIWAMEPTALKVFSASVATTLDRAAEKGPGAFFDDEPRAEKSLYAVIDGAAQIDIKGPLIEDVPDWLAMYFGITKPSSVQRAIEKAVNDEKAESIQLNVDSPGGYLGGITSLADTIYAVRGLKPITSRVDGMAASAAYWVASQADEIVAARTGQIGSIGVFTVLYDTSEAAKKAGIKTHVVRSDELKGTGTPGDPVTEKQLAAIRDNIDQLFALFKSDVKRGRGEKIKDEAFQGRVWIGKQAVSLGLVDKIEKTPAQKTGEEKAMNDEAKQAMEAKIAELEAANTALAKEKAEDSERAEKALDLAQSAADEALKAEREKAGAALIESYQSKGLAAKHLEKEDGSPTHLQGLAVSNPAAFREMADNSLPDHLPPAENHGHDGSDSDAPGGDRYAGDMRRVEQLKKDGMDGTSAVLEVFEGRDIGTCVSPVMKTEEIK